MAPGSPGLGGGLIGALAGGVVAGAIKAIKNHPSADSVAIGAPRCFRWV